MASMSSLRRRAISSTSQALMLRMGCLYGTHWHLSKHDANHIRMWIWMSLASQVLRLDGQSEEEGHKQHQPSVDAKGGVPVTHLFAALPNMMP